MCRTGVYGGTGEFVTVFRKNPKPSLGNVREEEVGVFRLDKGQTVREIK